MTTFIQSAVAAALISVFAAGAAQAQVQDRQATRAEVIAELQRARATGELERLQKDSGGYAALELGQPGKGLSRAEVVAELERARRSGEFKQLNANHHHAFEILG